MTDRAWAFGVSLKAAPTNTGVPDAATGGDVDRSKVNVYAWDDERLQGTAVVQRRITKAAKTVQRFIRACISHWRYYNSYRVPLMQELEDIKRRRREELEEVQAFLKRGYDQAKFELEAEVAMPQAEFLQLRKATNELKKQIKEEEEATLELDKLILEEHNTEKRLGREKHELEAQETLSRLDIEIPALEAERLELEGVEEEFGDIVKELKGQLDEMITGFKVEKKHKGCIMKHLAKIVKELEKRGAKPKVMQSVKLIIKHKGEVPPAPAPAPEAAPTPAPEPTTQSSDTTTKRPSNGEDDAKQRQSAMRATTSAAAPDLTEKSPANHRESTLRATTGSMPAVRISDPKDKGRSSKGRSKSPSKSRSRSPSKSKKDKGKSRKSKSTDNLDKERQDRRRRQSTRERSGRSARSLSPLAIKEKKNSSEKGDKPVSIGRSKTTGNLKRASDGQKRDEAPSFDWSTMTALSSSKDKDKKKKSSGKK